MGLRELLVLGLLVLLGIHWTWCTYVAYPLLLNKFIKRGRSWLYLPLKWKGILKRVVMFITPFILFSEIILVLAITRLFTSGSPVYIFLLYSALLIAGVFILHTQWLKWRLIQQEDSFFYIRCQISSQMNEKGKILTDRIKN